MLTIPLLDVDAFNGDEPYTLVAAGVLRAGPLSLVDTWTSVSPRQALGWPSLIAIWGRLVGWSEVAVRALPVFFGMLTLAWVYRTGRDLLAPRAGLFATLVLSASVFFIAYMIHARAFTLVALCSTLCIWSYWRIALHPQQPGKGLQAGLLLGSIGLLYSHYLGALLLPVLGLYHLLFVPKNRRWWRPVLLFGLATLVAALQFPFLLRGVAISEGGDPSVRLLTAPAILSHLLSYMTNGLVTQSPPAGEHLLLALLLVLMVAILLRKRAGIDARVVWLLVFASAALLLLVIVINELLKLNIDNRIRYLMPLWPMTALLVGAGLWRLANRHRILATGMLALWLISGAWLTVATDFRYELGYFFRTDFHKLLPVVHELVSASDLLIIDYTPILTRPGSYYDRKTTHENIYRYKVDPYETVRPVHANYPYLWLLYLSKDRVGFAELPHELGRVFCERALDEWGFTLERYALHSVANCPDRPIRLVFDSDIQLTAPEITTSDGLLRLDAHFRSADELLLAHYSLAVHVIDPRSGERVAQGDTGVGPGFIVPSAAKSTSARCRPVTMNCTSPSTTGKRESASSRYWKRTQVSDHTLHHFRSG